MRDYKLPRSRKNKARVLSPSGYVAVLMLVVFALIFALAVRRVWQEAQKPLPAPISDKDLLRHAQETERRL